MIKIFDFFIFFTEKLVCYLELYFFCVNIFFKFAKKNINKN